MNHHENQKDTGKEQPAFLLAQVGAHAAARFAERLTALHLTPPDVGILRLLRMAPGISQQELSARLQIHPSRLVAILDNLEKRKLVDRKPNPQDRRLYSLHLTKDGSEILQQIGKVAREHQDTLLSTLSSEERGKLTELLLRIAAEQGLTPGVHPGYQRLGKSKPAELKHDR
jgi:DNA-binding MarR family transcriptional regulator